MSKTNFFVKHLKDINIFINNLLEKNLNKLNFKNLSFLFKNNKIILTFVAVIVVFVSYLLLPTFYKQSEISEELKTELQNKLNLNFKFPENIKYNFFPRPHFTTNNSIISNNQNEISKIKKLKIYVSLDNLFSLKNMLVRDIKIENANFNLNKYNYDFFFQLLNKSFKNGNLQIKNSNIFFRNFDGEVLFINKILKMKYYFEPKDLKNIIYSDNEIFNIPYSIELNQKNNKNKILSKVNLDYLKLRIDNELDVSTKIKNGLLNFKVHNDKFISNCCQTRPEAVKTMLSKMSQTMSFTFTLKRCLFFVIIDL